MARVVLGPAPGVVDGGDVERVDGPLGVDARAGVGVEVPDAAEVGAGIEDFCAEVCETGDVEGVAAGEAGADYEDVEGGRGGR